MWFYIPIRVRHIHKFILAQVTYLAFFETDHIEKLKEKLCFNPLAQLTVLLDLGNWAVWYVEPCPCSKIISEYSPNKCIHQMWNGPSPLVIVQIIFRNHLFQPFSSSFCSHQRIRGCKIMTYLRPLFTKKMPSYGYRNPHYKPYRWSDNHQRFIMGFPIPIRWCLLSD